MSSEEFFHRMFQGRRALFRRALFGLRLETTMQSIQNLIDYGLILGPVIKSLQEGQQHFIFLTRSGLFVDSQNWVTV